MHTYTTQAEIRKGFWNAHPNLETLARKEGTFSKRQNAQNASIRVWFIDFVDNLHRMGKISEKLADKATL